MFSSIYSASITHRKESANITREKSWRYGRYKISFIYSFTINNNITGRNSAAVYKIVLILEFKKDGLYPDELDEDTWKHGKNTPMCHRTSGCQRNDNLSTSILLVKSKSLVLHLLKNTSNYCCPINLCHVCHNKILLYKPL